MTFRASAPRKGQRWFALLMMVAVATTLLATAVLAAPSFTFTSDSAGADDEPGQKDLTAQASAFDGTEFYSAWKWDDTSWSGKNTGDGCSLFNSGGSALNVDYAVCATIGGKVPTLSSVTVYSCSDGRPDRCTNPVLLDTSTSYCTITNGVNGQFNFPPDLDTQASCNISAISAALSIPALASSSLLNTCSYPSREPNSDPSDCVLEVPPNIDVSIGTASGGSITWTATLTDTATLLPGTATGSVTFKLYSGTPCVEGAPPTGNLIATSTDTTAPFAATDVVINSTDVTGNGPWVYYWTATYNPATGFNGDAEVCGEATTITASVAGTTVAP